MIPFRIKQPRSLLPLVLLAIALASPSALGTIGSFGDVLEQGDQGIVWVLEDDSDVPTRFAWLDSDTDDDEDDYDGGTIYIVQTTSRFTDGDIRLGGGSVDGRELDDDEELNSLSGSVRYFDDDGDGEFDTGDGLYFDISPSGEISDLDERIAGSGGSDEDDLESYSTDFTFFDVDGDGEYDEDDGILLDTDGDGLLTVADVGLSGTHSGDILQPGDEGVVHVLDTSGVPDTFAYVDGDGNGRLGDDEPVYLSTSSSEVTLWDVRLTDGGDGSPGEQVDTGDDDRGDPLETLSGELAFFDDDGSGEFSLPDTLYYDLSGNGEGSVSVRDVILTGPEAGELAGSNHADLGNGLASYDGNIAYLDRDGDEDWNEDDVVYLDTNDDGYATVNDVALGSDFGRVLLLEDDEVVYLLSTSNGPDTFMLLDDDGNERPSEGEAVYLSTGSNRLTTSSVRIAYPPVGSLGSQISSADRDSGASATEIDGELAYYDAENDEAFTDDDTLYFDLSGSGDGSVSVGDVILTGSDAGEVATQSHDELNRNLRSFDGAIAYLDANGNNQYDTGDGVFVDSDDDGWVTVGDVLLGGPVQRDERPEPEPDPDPEPEPEPEPEPDPEPDEDGGDEDDADDAPQARERSEQADRVSREASNASREASEAAKQANDAVGNASRSLDELLNASRDQRDAPSSGALALLITLAAMASLRTRRP